MLPPLIPPWSTESKSLPKGVPVCQDLSNMPLPKPRARILPVGALSEQTMSEMFDLFEKYYVEVSEAQFRSDLMEKTHVLMFKSGDELIGFSTIFRKRIPAVGEGTFLFLGDTVIREDFWGSKILQTTFLRYVVGRSSRTRSNPSTGCSSARASRLT